MLFVFFVGIIFLTGAIAMLVATIKYDFDFYGVFVVQKRIMNDISLRESFAVQKVDLVSHIELLPVE